MIDSHAHLQFDAFDPDREEVLSRARAAGLEALVVVGIDLASSRAALELANQRADVFAAAGLQPNSEIEDLSRELAGIEVLLRQGAGKFVALGEIGLDFHHRDVPREAQEERFLAQLDLARKLRLPVIIHCRDAFAELFDLLAGGPSVPSGVLHCFSGTWREAAKALDLGFHVSIAGNVTYPKASELREVAGKVPLGRLLVETDCPFLAPQGHRGKRNEPSFLGETIACVAEVRGIRPEELAASTSGAARSLFGIPEP